LDRLVPRTRLGKVLGGLAVGGGVLAANAIAPQLFNFLPPGTFDIIAGKIGSFLNPVTTATITSSPSFNGTTPP